MKKFFRFLIAVEILSFLLLTVKIATAAPVKHHEMQVKLIPSEHRIEVTDRITLSAPVSDLRIYLSPDLLSTIRSPDSEIWPEKGSGSTVLSRKGPADSFTISYGGIIDYPLTQVGREYARGQKDTAGSIGPEGVYLDGGSGWYPIPFQGRDQKITFDLTVELPAGWDAVSQGARTEHSREDGRTLVRWETDRPQDAIWLVAGRYTEYSRDAGGAKAMVFLREADADLAGKYLDATSTYLGMYEKLVGPYPYGKFALVENFWETGYGMPSFTLMGPRIIRFPFILHSSYPHEILHNWWGNSVYIDYRSGNWGEGLTAYLSDHLIKEQRGQGSQYRRETLQKYADYVLTGRDLPLTDFRSRHGSITEAVGYGKSLMLFHMLRRRLGDDVFIDGLRRFYSQYRFQTAGFENIRTVFEQVSGQDLDQFFDQWIRRAGAPELLVRDVEVSEVADGYQLTAVIDQVQDEEAYVIDIPLAVTVKGRDQAVLFSLPMDERSTEVKVSLTSLPLRLDVDPGFDLFRRLNRNEIPPALTQVFGAEQILIVLPSQESEPKRKAYEGLAALLSGAGPGQVEVIQDSDVTEFPEEKTVWLLGWRNQLLDRISDSLADHDVVLEGDSIRLEGSEVPVEEHSIVVTARNPGNPDLAVMWIAADPPEAMPGLGRKLPHYHKQSYLAFRGAEPENVVKGRWTVVDSPLTFFLPVDKEKTDHVPSAVLPDTAPLIDLPDVFSQGRMMDTVRLLSGLDMEGRGLGSEGLERAAEAIAVEFNKIGLLPGGDDPGSYYQSWMERVGEPGRETVVRNVIGILPGSNPDRERQSVVVGAHYDHLGRGWPGALSVNQGTVHPGADDNASGVAVLLELARVMAGGMRPDRTIVFAAFTGEEVGRVGSRHYVMNPGPYPVDEIMGMINLDTVGRLGGRRGNNRLLVLGAGSAEEWVHIFRGAGYVTGVEVQSVSDELDSSDHVSFQAAGVPAVQLFTGAHLDYHKPSDTADRVDPFGLTKVAAVAKEAVGYLASRGEALTAVVDSVSGKSEGNRDQGSGTRKVSLGTVPDFTYEGDGVRLDGVVPGSPADAAGLTAGDVIVRLGGEKVGGLKDLSNVLKAHSAGESLVIVFLRNGVEMTIIARLVER